MLHTRLTKYHCLLIAAMLAALLILGLTQGVSRLWLLTGLCSLSCLVIGLGVSFPQWQFFGQSLCCVRTSRRAVALTFDDGPDPENTPALLTLLAAQGVRATFFCIGERATRQPELIKRMAAEGHEVENHSFYHSPLTNLFAVRRLRDELARAQSEIHRLTGRTPEFFRPPVGLTNPRVFRATRKLGLKMAGYTSRGLDRRRSSPEAIVERLLRGLTPGAIFLLHDAGVPRERMLAVAVLLLDKLRAQGYQCFRLDELIAGEEKR